MNISLWNLVLSSSHNRKRWSINFINNICIWNPANILSNRSPGWSTLIRWMHELHSNSRFQHWSHKTIPRQCKLLYLHSINWEIRRLSKRICSSFVKLSSRQNSSSSETCVVLTVTRDTGINWWNPLELGIFLAAEYLSLRQLWAISISFDIIKTVLIPWILLLQKANIYFVVKIWSFTARCKAAPAVICFTVLSHGDLQWLVAKKFHMQSIKVFFLVA